jgi:uncharacterized protein YprB with RNaseH-like and TPR domain
VLKLDALRGQDSRGDEDIVVGHDVAEIDGALVGAAVAQFASIRYPELPDEPTAGTVAFLDVETTGLSSGAGTLVFLVGIALVRANSVLTQQFFLSDPSLEAAFLDRIAARLADCAALVTFNGRSFDVPMLMGRYDLHRMPDPTPRRHVDLLHLARRVWGRRLRRSNLTTLEAGVLGVIRELDLPGREVPERYFSYLRDRQADGIRLVFEHNRRDLLTMIELSARLGAMLAEEWLAATASPSDWLGLASLIEDSSAPALTRRCYENALASAGPTERVEALLGLARLARSYGDVAQTIELLATCAEFNVDLAIPACVELAKLLEHQLREPARALRYARRAFALLRERRTPVSARLLPDVAHRIQRLERKVGVEEAARPSRDSRHLVESTRPAQPTLERRVGH